MENKEQFNLIVAKNIASYRKHYKLTQAALAERLNYSDKAVAKWESGESLPEPYVLYQIANIFGITLNDLLSEKKIKTHVKNVKGILIPLLANCVVWLVALVNFITISGILEYDVRQWLSFIVAIPISFIVFLVFGSIYKKPIWQFISITCLIWSTLVTLHLFLIDVTPISGSLYFIGIPIQIAFTLAYGYVFLTKRKSIKRKNEVM